MSLLQEMEKFGLADCAFNRKLIKGQSMEFTDQDIINWLGSDFTRADFIDMLRDIANGIYRVEQLNQDITDYIEE
jgi:hypothetical protein